MRYDWIDDNGKAAPNWVRTAEGLTNNPTDEQLEAAGYHRRQLHVESEQEVAARERLSRIEELRMMLQESDYKALKYAEGWLTAEEYAAVKAERQAWREEINRLEAGSEVRHG